MSGYRLIHRERILGEDIAIWSSALTPLIRRRKATRTKNGDEAISWRFWAACSDGLIRVYLVREVSISQKETELTASAISFGEDPTHILRPSSENSGVLGCTSLSILRNYAGDDDSAGNVIIAGMDLSGTIRIWELDENFDEELYDQGSKAHSEIPPKVELELQGATGTAVALGPPRTVIPQLKCLIAAVAFQDGTVSLVSTGIAVPNAVQDKKYTVPEPGTILNSWGAGSAMACRLVFRPDHAQLAVSRQDGTVDVIALSATDQTTERLHRLSPLVTSPSRGLAFTTDGQMMIAGNDQGRLTIWDLSEPNRIPAIANHQVGGTSGNSWLWQIAPVDGRRFASLATDSTIKIWQVDQVHHQPLHIFASSDDIRLWSISMQALKFGDVQNPLRLVAGSESGWVMVYSMVDKV